MFKNDTNNVTEALEQLSTEQIVRRIQVTENESDEEEYVEEKKHSNEISYETVSLC